MDEQLHNLLNFLSDGLWHFKMDLVADPRLPYCRLRDWGDGYDALKRDLTKLKRVARFEYRKRPSGAYRLVAMTPAH
jgi:hypothetical protein